LDTSERQSFSDVVGVCSPGVSSLHSGHATFVFSCFIGCLQFKDIFFLFFTQTLQLTKTLKHENPWVPLRPNKGFFNTNDKNNLVYFVSYIGNDLIGDLNTQR
jgi:hypothetical protein